MKKGFTLIEILITIVLLTAGITSILQAISLAMAAESANNQNSAIARFLAQESMEEIKDAAAYDDIDDFAASKAALSGDYSSYSREITVSGDPKQVNVIVYWTAGGSENSIDLVTLFADYDY